MCGWLSRALQLEFLRRKGNALTVTDRFGRSDELSMRVVSIASIALAFYVLACLPAWAQVDGGYKALVEVQSHQISINRGQGFQQLGGITPVNPGDVVMASEGGHGWIVYPDCDVEVLPGKVYTVEDRPGVVEVKDAKEPRPICKRAFPYWVLAAPPILACAAFCFDDDDGRPASP